MQSKRRKGTNVVELNIGDIVYKMILVPRIPKESPDTLGLHDPAEETIWIKSGLTAQGTIRTMWHELIHAWEETHDLKIKHNEVYKLERALGDFIRDNPEFVQGMIELLKGK